MVRSSGRGGLGIFGGRWAGGGAYCARIDRGGREGEPTMDDATESPTPDPAAQLRIDATLAIPLAEIECTAIRAQGAGSHAVYQAGALCLNRLTCGASVAFSRQRFP